MSAPPASPGAAPAPFDGRPSVAARQVGEVIAVMGLTLCILLMPDLRDARYGGPTPPRVALFVVSLVGATLLGLLVMRAAYRTGHGPRTLGLRAEGFAASLLGLLPWTLGAMGLLYVGMRAWGVPLDPVVPKQVMKELFRYPLWALAQQALVLGWVHRRLTGAGASDGSATYASAAFFAAMHAPNWPVVACTGIMGLVWGHTFARHGNLVAIALSHAALGIFADEVLDMDLHVGLHHWERLAYRASLGG